MWDHLSSARDRYISFFRKGIRQRKETHPTATPELLLLPDGNEDIPELYRLYRMDLIWKNEQEQHKMNEFNLDPLPDLPAMLEGTVGNMNVVVYPVIWNAVEFRFEKFDGDWSELDRWYQKWLNTDDTNFRDVDGLSGVVHHAARPDIDGDLAIIPVDFGSAPVNAVMELLQVLETIGVKRVEVGSFSYIVAA
jgi:hypothetical protein